MSEHCPQILLLEDTRTVQNYIKDVLRALPATHELQVAKRIEEAQRIAAMAPIDVFIVDIGLPDGDGIDFLCEMATLHPHARALIITSTPRDDYRDRARQLGVLSFLPKPLQRKELLETVTRLLEAPPMMQGASLTEQTQGFEGTLGGLSPADIIQLKCLSRASGVVEFTTDEHYGMVWFENGEVIHSEAEDSDGKTFALDAFHHIVRWRSGTVREVVYTGAYPRTISRSWQTLLMDSESHSVVTH